MSVIQIFAGPNGSGKSTVTNEITPVGVYINADEIQQHLHCSTLEAAQNAERAREYCLSHNMDFTMETVLSTTRNLNLINRAKEQGYYIVCIFVLTCDPNINVQRVADRVAHGGHDVPEEKIRSRYGRSLENLPYLLELCHELYVFDNSKPRHTGEPALIAQSRCGSLKIFPSCNWKVSALEALMSGRYPKEYLK